MARVQRAMGRDEDALAGYRETIVLLERMRANAVPTEASKAGVIATHRQTYIETIDLLIELKREAEALNVAEAYRARVLLEMIAESKIDLRQDLTKEQREREENLFNRISTIQKELWKEGLPEEREQQLKQEPALRQPSASGHS